MNETFQRAADAMAASITDDEGELLPITRVTFELVPGRAAVLWSLFEGRKLLYASEGGPESIPGFLEASKGILEMRLEDHRNGRD